MYASVTLFKNWYQTFLYRSLPIGETKIYLKYKSRNTINNHHGVLGSLIATFQILAVWDWPKQTMDYIF